MAVVQWNALSTNLFGSFEALTLLPGAEARRETGERLPVLYLMHDNGENALQFLRDPELEALCEEKKMVICCPWISHSLGQDLRWGGKFGRFAGKEFPEICGHMFPVDQNRAMIGGVGTGAYAAFSLARQYPRSFRNVIGYNGVYDMESLYREAKAGETVHHLTLPMVEAALGSLEEFAASEKNASVWEKPEGAAVGCAADWAGEKESRALADRWGIPLHTGTLAQMIASCC